VKHQEQIKSKKGFQARRSTAARKEEQGCQ
jgi:hypothetical protein